MRPWSDWACGPEASRALPRSFSRPIRRHQVAGGRIQPGGKTVRLDLAPRAPGRERYPSGFARPKGRRGSEGWALPAAYLLGGSTQAVVSLVADRSPWHRPARRKAPAAPRDAPTFAAQVARTSCPCSSQPWRDAGGTRRSDFNRQLEDGADVGGWCRGLIIFRGFRPAKKRF